MSRNILEITSLVKHYKHKGRQVTALDNIELCVAKGEMVSIVGESGCGKTTLARCIAGLEKWSEGDIQFAGSSLSDRSRAEMRQIRRRMQMVFQNPYASFHPRQTLERGLRESAAFYGLDQKQTAARLAKLLSYVKLDEEVLKRYPQELSGGQLQRVAIVRALIPQPDLLIADEAVSALDVSVQAQILNILTEIQRQEEMAVLFISHDLSVVEHISDRTIVMYAGKIIESGRKEDVFANPIHPYTRMLLDSQPVKTPWERKQRARLSGETPNILNLPDGCRFWPRCTECRSGLCDTCMPIDHEMGNGHRVLCHLVQNQKTGS